MPLSCVAHGGPNSSSHLILMLAVQVWGAAEYSCLWVEDSGTTATAVDCEFRDAGETVVRARAHGQVTLRGTTRVTAGRESGGRREKIALKVCSRANMRLVGGGVTVQGREVLENGGTVDRR